MWLDLSLPVSEPSRQSPHYSSNTECAVNTWLDCNIAKSTSPYELYSEVPLTPHFFQTGYENPADRLTFSAVAAAGGLLQKGPSSDAWVRRAVCKGFGGLRFSRDSGNGVSATGVQGTITFTIAITFTITITSTMPRWSAEQVAGTMCSRSLKVLALHPHTNPKHIP